jgi:hypothetical protein
MRIVFLGADYLQVFKTSCPAVRSIHAKKRGIHAYIGANLILFEFLNLKAKKNFKNLKK